MTLSAHPDAAPQFAAQVSAYLRSCGVAGIPNLVTTVACVGAGAQRVPVSVNASEPQDSWVCSPHTAYVRYAIEELQRFGHPRLARPLTALCRTVGRYLWQAQVDHAVVINNWLLSTNLYPGLDEPLLGRWHQEALDRWPDRAIWFRSLNGRYTAPWMEALTRAGFTLIPSRQVYLYDRIDPNAAHPANLRRDLQLLATAPMVRSDATAWSDADFARAARLYAQLYLEKYSILNPAYSADFLKSWHGAGLLQLHGWRDTAGQLQAVVGLFALGDTVTAPIVGYDTHLPQRLGLYRLLMATVYDCAARAHCRINLSAGAAGFKRLRGGIGTLEFSAVYARHLPKARRRALAVLSSVTRHIGGPILRRFEL
jgi:Acetyltransferase (GNAT) domain